MFDNGTTSSARALARGFFLALGLVAGASLVSEAGAQTSVVNTATVTTPAGVTDPTPGNNTSSATLNVSPAVPAYSFCSAPGGTATSNAVFSIVGGSSGVQIWRYEAGAAADAAVAALALPSVNGNVNGLMVDPVRDRLLFHATNGSMLWAYDADNGGWYQALSSAIPISDLPRAGMDRNGVGYLVAGTGAPTVYRITANATGFGYSAQNIGNLRYDVAPTNLGSGDIAFDAAGFGWLSAGVDLYRIDFSLPGNPVAVRQTRPLLNGQPSSTQWAGVAFGDDGRLYFANNSSPSRYFSYDRATGELADRAPTGANGSRDLASCAYPAPLQADLSVVKSLSQVNGVAPTAATRVRAGDQLNYAITFTNNGGAADTLFPGEVRETVPANTVHVAGRDGFTCTGTSCSNTAALNVRAGGTATLNFTVDVVSPLPGSATSIANTVSFNGDVLDCAAAGNVCSVTTPVGPAVTVSKSADTATNTAVTAGQTLTYTLTATIANAAILSDVVLTDTLGDGLTFGAVVEPGSFVAGGTGAVRTFTLPAGTAPGTYTVRYTANVDADAAVRVTNSVTAAGGDDPSAPSPVPPVCTSCSTSHPLAASSVTIVKNADPASGTTVAAGATLTYTLSATVADAATTEVVTLTDTLGAGLSFGAVTSPGILTCTGSLSCTLPSGTVPGTYTVSYTATVDADAAGTLRNAVVASVPPGGTQPTPVCTTCSTEHNVLPQITATDDPLGQVNGAVGNPNAGNAYDNDTLGGAPVDPADITGRVVTPATPINGGLVPMLDPVTGIVSVPAGTPAGSYQIAYEICDALNPTNCATATITVTVDASPLAATDDPLGPVNGAVGNPNAGNAYDNDTLGGAPVDPADITGRVVTPATPINGGPVPVLDPATGIVSVPPGTPAGSYEIEYEICDALNPTNCATATITVTVDASPIAATDDPLGPVNGAVGNSNAGNAYDNDTLGGAPVDPADITGRVVTPATPINGGPVPVLDPATGVVSVPPGTPAGSYEIEYEICEVLNPTNCATATITVTVDASPIAATDDPLGPVNGAVGNPNAGNAYDNDTLGGAPVDPADITGRVVTPATPINGGPVPVLDPLTGVVSVPPGTPAGSYEIEYEICDALNPTNCATATITVTVDASPIAATDDPLGAVNGAVGNPNAGNAYDNDTLGGAPVDPADITGRVVTPATPINGGPVPVLDPATGVVSVPAGTPAGSYEIEYEICEALNPTNCANATITVTVEAPLITAIDDTYTGVNGASGDPAVGNVLAGDTLNGVVIIDPSLVDITIVGTLPPQLTVDLDTGVIGVLPGTPAGDYTFEYQICEVLNPTNCSTAKVTITVEAPAIVAIDDTLGPVNGGSGNPNVGNVLDGDTLNGQPVTDPALADITIVGTLPGGITVDLVTGVIGVTPGTPAGDYTFEYQICEVLNPSNCSTATVTITVEAPAIVAIDDTLGPVNGGSGNPNVGNVLDGDTLNGQPVTDPSLVDISIVGTLPGGITVDLETGVIGVAPGTPAGDYTFEYQICEVLNPTNCSTASVTITVVAPDVTAVDDSTTTDQNTPVTIPVLDNDTLNGVPVDPDSVTITVTPPGNGSVVVNPDGSIVYTPAPGFAGDDRFTYTICETTNPDNCATATVVVTVRPNVVEAIDDDAGTAESGVPLQIVVVGNDRSTGAPLDPNSITVITPAGHGSVVCANGICTYTPEFGFAGEDRFTYRVCDTSFPVAICDTATVTIRVEGVSPLRVTKTAAVREVKVGDLVRYTVTVENIGNAVVSGASVVDTPPAGFSYVDGSLAASDGRALSVTGTRPIRIASLDLAPGESLTMSYLLRVGAGIRAGGHVNQVQAQSAGGIALSNIATAQVQTAFDPLLDDSLVFGTVFDDRNGDGWQASAALRDVRVQGGFAPGAYIAGSTTIDHGDGPQPLADASAPLLHGVVLDTIAGRQSVADPVEANQIVIRQRLRSADFTDDFVLTSGDGATLRMSADGSTRLERSGDVAKGLSAAEPVVSRRVSQDGEGVLVEYVIGNVGIDERGIPGVRIASVEGLLIETDQYGRYHLVDVPGGTAAHGRNFILKVDPATLPPGTTFTTANPLVRRVTAGLPVRFDFGVRLPVVELQAPGETVEMTLGEVMFDPDSSALRADMLPAIEAMAREVDRHGGGSIVITGEGGQEALAFARAASVRDALQGKVSPAAAQALQVELRTRVEDPHALVAGVGNGDVLLGTVLFDTDRATIRPEFAALLDAVAARLETLGGGVVGIVGHTDVRGPHAYNVDLGLRRARAVYDALAGRLSPEVRANTRVEATRDPAAPVGEVRK